MKDKIITQRIILGGALIRNGKILILQRHKNEKIYPGMWELPSGKKNLLELSKDSLLREIKEETSLDTEIITPFSVFDYKIEKGKNIYDSTQINFLVRPKNNEPVKLSKEHQDFTWISEGETDKYNLSAATKNVIKRAFEIVRLLKLI